MPLTLGIDCGGGSIKGGVADTNGILVSEYLREPTPYPLSPRLLVELVGSIAQRLPAADRVTVGMPGMIRHGRVITTPHYITAAGPGTTVVPALVDEWEGFDLASALSYALGIPALILNDANVHGCALIEGTGREVVFTFGTGLGNAIFDDGVLAPDLEFSRGPSPWGVIYDDYIGESTRREIGNVAWSRRVQDAVESLRPVLVWDRLYLGGGNAARILPEVISALGDGVQVVSNTAGVTGAVRAWDLAARRLDW